MSTKMRTVIILALTLTIMGQKFSNSDLPIQYLAPGLNAFSQSLYRQLGQGHYNSIYSPYSIHSALSLAYFGAQGQTAVEMNTQLRFLGLNPRSAYKTLTYQLLNQRDVTVDVAYAVILCPNVIVDPNFTRDVKSTFWSTDATFDSSKGSVEQAVNNYIAVKTENNIAAILKQGAVTPETSILLVSAIFVKGLWVDPFSQQATREQQFTLLGGQKKWVPMMHGDKYVSIKKDYSFGVDVVQLPLRGGRFGFYIALPHQTAGIDALERVLTETNEIERLLNGLTPAYVRLAIPKFRIESHYDLRESIQQLGFYRAFSPNYSDFSGISKHANLYISGVFHAAVIDVQESGLTAAGATAVKTSVTSRARYPQETFIADHNFIFFVRDNLLGEILFQGKFSG